MNRRVLAFSSLLAAASLLAACVDTVHAQGGGRGGRGGFGRFGRSTHQLQLATLPEVETELKLTDEQKTTIADLNDQFDDERRNQGFGGGGGGGGFSEEARAARAKMNADFAAKLNEALDEPQQKRIQEIYVQVNGASVLTDESVAAALVLTDEQKQALQDALADQRQAMQDAFQGWQDMSDEERTAKMDELSKARDEALLAVLTDEQKTQFEAMKGTALEVDLSPLRGRGFGGGGGRGRGGRGGGNDGGNGDDR